MASDIIERWNASA